MYGAASSYPDACKIALRSQNLRLMAADEAILGGVRGTWLLEKDKEVLLPSEVVDFANLTRLLDRERESTDA